MENIFSFIEYRDYLLAVYSERKGSNPLFSYRMMGNGMGMDASYLAKVLGKTLHLGPKQVPAVIQYLKLKGSAAEYFQLMVQFTKARTAATASALYNRMSTLRPLEFHSLDSDQYEIFRSWVNPALRSLLGFYRYTGSHRELGAQLEPAVETAEIKKSLHALERTGLVRKTPDGDFIPAHAHIGTGSLHRPLAAREFQRQASLLQAEALDHVPRAERDISTLTVAGDEKALADIREIVRNCRLAIQKRIDECERPNRVYQINLGVFPLSKTIPPEQQKDTP